MTNSETLVRPHVTHRQLGWLHSRNRLNNRLDDMFAVAARIDHQVRVAFTSQVRAARTATSFHDLPHRYEVHWAEEVDDDPIHGTVIVTTERIGDSVGRELIRFRLVAPAAAALVSFASRPVEERQFVLMRDHYTMDSWSLSLVCGQNALDVRFDYEP